MVSSLQHVDACVPVTALKALPWSQQNFILQGQGPWMHVIEDESGDVMTRVRVFKRNNVHGFIPLSQGVDEQAQTFARILIWGGLSLRLVDLRSNSSDGVISTLASSEFLAPDWIMSGCAAVKDQLVAAYLVTANNALLSLTLQPSHPPRYDTSLEIRQLATSVKSILCAADLIALSPTHVLIAAGTIFGEIIVWSCFTGVAQGSPTGATGSIHHFFTGHDGTVFGVRISPLLSSLRGDGQPGRLLASCSDDRTLRLWDISDCEHKSVLDPSSYSTDGFGLRSTGFGSTSGDDKDSEGCIAKAFGHGARIWSILFRSIISSNPSRIGLVTRGEDATCVAWNLSWSTSDSGSTKYDLSQQSSTHAHFGKHIWSMDLRGSGDDTVIYTGGADGALRSFRVSENRNSNPDLPPINTHHQPGNTPITHFDFVDSDYLIACNNQNTLYIGLAQPDSTSSPSWEPVSDAGKFGLINKIRGVPDEGLALISNGQGHVCLYNHSNKSVSDLTDLPGRPLNLFFLPVPSGTESSKSIISFLASYANDDIATLVTVENWNKDTRQAQLIQIKLPKSPFAIASACLVNGGEYLLLGSKLGGLSIHPVNSTLPTDAIFVERRVHGHDGTNDIQEISSAKGEDGSNLENILTCGRDGRICVHEIQFGTDPADPPRFRTVHRSESGLAGNVEGAYLEERTGDLISYGFRSQNFVLYNESKQLDLISVNSGGARRSWAFHPRSGRSGSGILFWRDKAGLKSCVIEDDNNRLVRAGVHGREVKAADAIEANGQVPPLYVTGAEDTLVRIFTSPQTNTVSPWGHFHTLRSLSTHRSGVQHVSWSKTGKFLFTSAAEEEFFVWRIRWIPPFGLATHLVASAPKGDPDSELRITSFDMVEAEESTGDCGFLLCLTFSNSVVKIFHYSPSSDNTFSLLAQGRYMENCLTQSSFLVQESSVTLLTAATDGYLTVWDLTTTLEPFYTIKSSVVRRKDAVPASDTAPEDIVCEDRYQIHSNSIKAMEVVSISPTTTAVLSGSDDNSISISILRRTQTSTSEPQIDVTSTLIPDAHAASVTAIKSLNQLRPSTTADRDTVKIIFASSGNDHQVKIWELTLDSSESNSPGINLQLLQDRYSSVADISSFTLVRPTASHGELEDKMSDMALSEREIQLLVCGVGIEILKLRV